MISSYAVRTLQEAGFSEAQAATVLKVVVETVNKRAATKADLKDVSGLFVER